MNIFVFSTNKEIKEHFVKELSDTDLKMIFYSSLEKLSSAIANENSANLIYHLGLQEIDEAELKAFQLRFKQKINTLVLSNTPNPEQGVRLLSLNVRGYANSYLEHDKLMMAISVIQQGEIWLGSAFIQYLLNKVSDSFLESSPASVENTTDVFTLLTTREQQIAQKILLGQQNKMIADLLSITERTVKAHLSTIFKKLGVRNRLELTLKLQQANRRTIS